jgi:hypothetical protein
MSALFCLLHSFFFSVSLNILNKWEVIFWNYTFKAKTHSLISLQQCLIRVYHLEKSWIVLMFEFLLLAYVQNKRNEKWHVLLVFSLFYPCTTSMSSKILSCLVIIFPLRYLYLNLLLNTFWVQDNHKLQNGWKIAEENDTVNLHYITFCMQILCRSQLLFIN